MALSMQASWIQQLLATDLKLMQAYWVTPTQLPAALQVASRLMIKVISPQPQHLSVLTYRWQLLAMLVASVFLVHLNWSLVVLASLPTLTQLLLVRSAALPTTLPVTSPQLPVLLVLICLMQLTR